MREKEKRASKPVLLKKALSEAVKIVSFINSQYFSVGLCKILCNKLGSVHKSTSTETTQSSPRKILVIV